MIYRHKQTGWLGVIADTDGATVCISAGGFSWAGTVAEFQEQWEAV